MNSAQNREAESECKGTINSREKYIVYLWNQVSHPHSNDHYFACFLHSLIDLLADLAMFNHF